MLFLAESRSEIGVGVPLVRPRERAWPMPRADRRHSASLVEAAEVFGDLLPRQIATRPPDGLANLVKPTLNHGRYESPW
jgi:hypothetical protein